jgi:O-antigen/teichoic acid export membrane protein
MTDPAKRAGRGRSLALGLGSQGFSSATSFGLTLMAARVVGPSGLGRIFLGFAAYQVALGLLRALLIAPLVARSAALDERSRAHTASAALWIALGLALGSAATLTLGGVLIGGSIGSALVIVAPWLPAALLHELWRWILFRDGRPGAATFNDAVWLALMALSAPIAWMIGTDWSVLMCWGIGASGGALLGYLRVSPGRTPPFAAWRWWRRELWPFGRWMAGAQVLETVLANATAFVVAGVVGAAALGGLRAAESFFAPLSLIIPGLALPGLPAIVRAASDGEAAQRSIATRLSAIALGAVLVYVAAMALFGVRLFPVLFGSQFAPYENLLWPFAAGQAAAAVGVGMTLLLTARQRGGSLMAARTVGAGGEFGLTAPLAAAFGALGAAWAAAFDSVASTLTSAWTLTGRRSVRWRSAQKDGSLVSVAAATQTVTPDAVG